MTINLANNPTTNLNDLITAENKNEQHELELDMKHRATKGGVTEKGISTFRSYFTEHLRQATREWMDGTLMRAFLTVRRGLLI